MIDGRFHVASLIALFCALGTGLLIGGALTNNDVVREQQQLWMQTIEADVSRLRADKATLAAELDYTRQLVAFGDAVMADAAARAFQNSLSTCAIALQPADVARADGGPDALSMLLQQLGAVVIAADTEQVGDNGTDDPEQARPHVRIVRTETPWPFGESKPPEGEAVIFGVPGLPLPIVRAPAQMHDMLIVPFSDTPAGHWRLVMAVLETGCGDGT